MMKKRSDLGLGSALFGISDPGLVKKGFFKHFFQNKLTRASGDAISGICFEGVREGIQGKSMIKVGRWPRECARTIENISRIRMDVARASDLASSLRQSTVLSQFLKIGMAPRGVGFASLAVTPRSARFVFFSPPISFDCHSVTAFVSSRGDVLPGPSAI